jgi:hypothetical protein
MGPFLLQTMKQLSLLPQAYSITSDGFYFPSPTPRLLTQHLTYLNLPVLRQWCTLRVSLGVQTSLSVYDSKKEKGYLFVTQFDYQENLCDKR